MIGAEMVSTAVQQGFKVIGLGGPLMQEKGLQPLWDYNELPVSGVGDVVPKYFSLKNVFEVLSDAAESRKCLGIVEAHALCGASAGLGVEIQAGKPL